ncbi:MAG: glutamyl-tRNA(Gln) amidotransferase, subunit [Gammaproteobacteria bacterium]|jgi:aspartyl-tRNA(Asn)/glutamyl-tRNA(Gln) amidotransferase subunit B|nr:glutamyl-tRNA(Gln) amidotransferase, subunit [Gammaproteobacteria bacterium]
MEWEAVIGLEVHAQLSTKSKIFSGAATAYGALPNTQACFIDLGMPGVLPVLNKEAVVMAARFGLAIGARVEKRSVFARKNYFYPDLPKGYQISQFEHPIVSQGKLDIIVDENTTKTIEIIRAHLEEDAGKSLHENFQGMSGIDLNRAGTPLLEIVSAPEMRSAKEAVAYLKTLHTLVRYLGICDGNMQEGSFRCDANVSVRPKGQEKLGTRTETKNVNSFRFVEKAINYEIERQIQVLESGGKIVQETRLYDADKNITRSMRAKEDANDYRYFPDPDLLPLVLSDEFIAAVKSQLPELPQEKAERFQTQYGLSAYDAMNLISDMALADYFETVAAGTAKHDQKTYAKLAANWIMGDLSAFLNKENKEIGQSPVSASQLQGLLNRIMDNTISGKIAKTVFETLWEAGGNADEIIKQKGLIQITDSTLINALIDEVIAVHPEQVAEYRSGKEKLFGFFVGQMMKKTQGKANPDEVNKLLKTKLNG